MFAFVVNLPASETPPRDQDIELIPMYKHNQGYGIKIVHVLIYL